MGLFDSKIALAKRLITKYGQSVTLVRVGLGSTSDKPWRPSPNTETLETVSAVFLNYDIRQIDGELIKRGDQNVFLSPVDTATPPRVGDVIRRPVETGTIEQWNVIGVRPLAPNGEFILYELDVRR